MSGELLLQDDLLATARRLPTKIALVCQKQRVPYDVLDATSNALAQALVARGVRCGDRVVLFAANSVESVIAFWAVLKANAIVSMVDPLTKADTLACVLRDGPVKALITDAHLTSVFADAARRCPALGCIVVSGHVDAARTHGLRGLVGWREALGPCTADGPPPRRRASSDVAAIVGTPDAEGAPRRVMHTHGAMRAAAASLIRRLENVEDDVIVDVLPLSLACGLYPMISAFMAGARLVLERSFAHPAEVLATAAAEGVTGFAGVPSIFATLAERQDVKRMDFRTLRYVANMDMTCTERVLGLEELFPTAKVLSTHGVAGRSLDRPAARVEAGDAAVERRTRARRVQPATKP